MAVGVGVGATTRRPTLVQPRVRARRSKNKNSAREEAFKTYFQGRGQPGRMEDEVRSKGASVVGLARREGKEAKKGRGKSVGAGNSADEMTELKNDLTQSRKVRQEKFCFFILFAPWRLCASYLPGSGLSG